MNENKQAIKRDGVTDEEGGGGSLQKIVIERKSSDGDKKSSNNDGGTSNEVLKCNTAKSALVVVDNSCKFMRFQLETWLSSMWCKLRSIGVTISAAAVVVVAAIHIDQLSKYISEDSLQKSCISI